MLTPAKALGHAHFMANLSDRGNSISLSAPGGGEGQGEVGDSERSPSPTSPSHACGAGPFLSPLKGGEGFLSGPVGCVHALARQRGPEPTLARTGGSRAAFPPWIPAFAGMTRRRGNSFSFRNSFLVGL